MMSEAEGEISYVGFVGGGLGGTGNKVWISRNNGTSKSESAGFPDESDDKANEQNKTTCIKRKRKLEKIDRAEDCLHDGYDNSHSERIHIQGFSALNNGNYDQIFANAHCCDTYQNLNQGDLSSTSESNSNVGVSFNACSAVMGRGEEILSEQCVEDEHEVRREEKRMLNNEAARRSRGRKKKHYEKLKTQMVMLRKETSMLTQELIRHSVKCETIKQKNRLLLEELKRVCPLDVISSLEAKYPCLVEQSISYETEDRNQDETEDGDQESSSQNNLSHYQSMDPSNSRRKVEMDLISNMSD